MFFWQPARPVQRGQPSRPSRQPSPNTLTLIPTKPYPIPTYPARSQTPPPGEPSRARPPHAQAPPAHPGHGADLASSPTPSSPRRDHCRAKIRASELYFHRPPSAPRRVSTAPRPPRHSRPKLRTPPSSMADAASSFTSSPTAGTVAGLPVRRNSSLPRPQRHQIGRAHV